MSARFRLRLHNLIGPRLISEILDNRVNLTLNDGFRSFIMCSFHYQMLIFSDPLDIAGGISDNFKFINIMDECAIGIVRVAIVGGNFNWPEGHPLVFQVPW